MNNGIVIALCLGVAFFSWSLADYVREPKPECTVKRVMV